MDFFFLEFFFGWVLILKGSEGRGDKVGLKWDSSKFWFLYRFGVNKFDIKGVRLGCGVLLIFSEIDSCLLIE